MKPGVSGTFAARLRDALRSKTPAALKVLQGARRTTRQFAASLPLPFAIMLSALLHLIVLSLTFVTPPPQPAAKDRNLEVVLVNASRAKAPEKADVLAQANLDGGGPVAPDARTSTPAPATTRRQEGNAPTDAQRAPTPPRPQTLAVREPEPKPAPVPEPEKRPAPAPAPVPAPKPQLQPAPLPAPAPEPEPPAETDPLPLPTALQPPEPIIQPPASRSFIADMKPHPVPPQIEEPARVQAPQPLPAARIAPSAPRPLGVDAAPEQVAVLSVPERPALRPRMTLQPPAPVARPDPPAAPELPAASAALPPVASAPAPIPPSASTTAPDAPPPLRLPVVPAPKPALETPTKAHTPAPTPAARPSEPAPVARPPEQAVARARQPAPPPEPAASGFDLMNSIATIARLEAQIDRRLDEYAKRPRKAQIGARAKEHRFAQYVEDWRQKVERIGTLNYPEEARGRIYGSLVMTVAIRADGTVERIEVDRSSGYPVLDAAAVSIVRLAAPYSPFPPDIRVDTDIVEITRTWTFTNANQVRAD